MFIGKLRLSSTFVPIGVIVPNGYTYGPAECYSYNVNRVNNINYVNYVNSVNIVNIFNIVNIAYSITLSTLTAVATEWFLDH